MKNKPTTINCNYADNYYGDQICVIEEITQKVERKKKVLGKINNLRLNFKDNYYGDQAIIKR